MQLRKLNNRAEKAVALLVSVLAFLIVFGSFAPLVHAETNYPIKIYFGNPGSENMSSHPSLDMTGVGTYASIDDKGASGGYNALITLENAEDVENFVMPHPTWKFWGGNILNQNCLIVFNPHSLKMGPTGRMRKQLLIISENV